MLKWICDSCGEEITFPRWRDGAPRQCSFPLSPIGIPRGNVSLIITIEGHICEKCGKETEIVVRRALIAAGVTK